MSFWIGVGVGILWTLFIIFVGIIVAVARREHHSYSQETVDQSVGPRLRVISEPHQTTGEWDYDPGA